MGLSETDKPVVVNQMDIVVVDKLQIRAAAIEVAIPSDGITSRRKNTRSLTNTKGCKRS